MTQFEIIALDIGATDQLRAPGAGDTLVANQTWNNGATTFTGLQFNVTDTASNAASLLADFRVGGSSVASVSKAGMISARSGGYNNPGFRFGNSGNDGLYWSGGLYVLSSGAVPLNTTSIGVNTQGSYGLAAGGASVSDTIIDRDAADTLAQRRGTNAQTFRIYNTYTDASNYERGFMRWSSNVLQIGTEAAGTGVARVFALFSGGAERARISATGDVGIGTSNPLNRLHVYSTTSVDGISLDGTNNPSIVLRSSATTVGYAPVVVTGAGAFFSDTVAGDMAFRSESNSIRMGSGAGVSTLAIGAGKIGVNVGTPTAYLHVAAGTATADTAPIKLSAGTNLTTPENGAFEYDGTNLYFTTGGTRRTVTLI